MMMMMMMMMKRKRGDEWTSVAREMKLYKDRHP